MTSLIDYLRGKRQPEKWNDPILAPSVQAVSGVESNGNGYYSTSTLLDILYSRFSGLYTPTIGQASIFPISPSCPSLVPDPEDIFPLTWKDIPADSHPAQWQLESIIANHDSRPWTTVSDLDPEQFQAVMDQLQLILDYTPRMEIGPRTAAIKCLQAIGSLSERLPASMMIEEVIQESDKPSCGGGFADVWFGQAGSQRVALKVLRTFGNDDDEEHTRISKAFRQEALLWRQLRHPHILPLFGVNTVTFSPRPCLVSPYMYNGNANQFLQKAPAHNRLQMMVEIMDGIHFLHAHDRPLVHGDIRGANILIKDDFTCCISDFGLTTVIDSRIMSSRLTGGAARWLAPEVFDETENVEDMPSRDIYAFGCTVIELCSGKAPFPNIRRDPGIYVEVLLKKMKPPQPPTTFLPQSVWDIVDECLAYEAKHRPNTVDVLERLRVIHWKEVVWYDFKMLLQDSENFFEGTPFEIPVFILVDIVDATDILLDGQESMTVHLIPFTRRLEMLLGVMRDKRYFDNVEPACEQIQVILRDINTMLERMCVRQLSVRDVTADEYLPEVKNLFRRVDEGVDDFELDLASAGDRHSYDSVNVCGIFNVTQPMEGVYTIAFDKEDGVTVATKFTVYDTIACTNQLGYLVVDTITESECILRCVEGHSFDIPDSGAFALRTPRSATENVFCGTADFYWNIRGGWAWRGSSDKWPPIRVVEHECRELGDGMVPIGNNLLVDGILHIEIGTSPESYEFRFVNTSKIPLFVSVMYFSTVKNFTIDSYYEHPSTGPSGDSPSLPAQSSTTVVYSPGGAAPWTLDLNKGPVVHFNNGPVVQVKYLKFFFCNQYVDFRKVQAVDSRFYEIVSADMFFFTTVIPIVLCRKDSMNE